MSRSKDLADSAEVINFLDNITTDINSGLTSKLSISTNLSDLADADVALVNLGLTATATELNYTDGVTSNIQTQLDTKLASASYTASDVLTKVKTVDGAASGLDADLLDGQHGSYYTGYTDTAISNLVDSAPGALNTLNELAAALGDDASFSTTVTNSIALKAPLASPTFTGTVTADDLIVEDSSTYAARIGSSSYYWELGSVGGSSPRLNAVGTNASSTFLINDVEAMRIDSSGNVGIGTNSPSSLYAGAKNLVIGSGTGEAGMTIYSSASNYGNIYFADGTTGSAPYAGYIEYNHTNNFMRVGVNASERMRIDSSGNVGIGTSSPTAGLECINALGAIVARSSQASSTITSLRFMGGAYTGNKATAIVLDGVSGENRLYLGGGTSFGEPATDIRFYTGTAGTLALGSEKMRIDSSGNVGIGTTLSTTPSSILTVKPLGTNGRNISLFTNGSTGNEAGIFFNQIQGTGNLAEIKAEYVGTNSGHLKFHTSLNERMRIDSSGNVGIGTSSPLAKLHVGNVSALVGNLSPTAAINSDTIASGTEENTLGIYQSASTVSSVVGLVAGVVNGASPYFSIKTRPTAGGDSVERMRIDSSGNLLVGKTAKDFGATVGSELGPEGALRATRNGAAPCIFSRLTSDGDIVQIVKNNVVAGSIGTYVGDVYIGTGDAGLWFQDGGNAIRPFRVDTVAGHDASIDLGHSTNRFKDAHFSGTINANAFVGDGSGLTGVGGGAWELLHTTTISTLSSYITITSPFSSTYDTYRIHFDGLDSTNTSPVDLQFWLRKNGANQTSSYASTYWSSDGSYITTNTASQGFLIGQMGNASWSGNFTSGFVEINSANTTAGRSQLFQSQITNPAPSGIADVKFLLGNQGTSGVVQGFTLNIGSGDFQAGTIKVYGLKKS